MTLSPDVVEARERIERELEMTRPFNGIGRDEAETVAADIRAVLDALDGAEASRKAWLAIASNGCVSLNKLAADAKAFWEQNFKLGNDQHHKDDATTPTP